MTRDSSSMRLGNLLTAAGMLTVEQLREAVEIARQQVLPVGRVLIMYGYLSGLQLQAAIHLQSMLKDALIDYDLALKVLKAIADSNIPVEDALRQLGWERSDIQPKTNKLGELLLAAGIVNQEQLDLGLQHSGVTGLPMGRGLINLGIISEQLLSSALSAQVLIRERRISREKAIQGLIAAKDRQIPLEQSLEEINQVQLPLRPGVRLGQLLVMAGLLEEQNLMHALELGLVQEQPIGKMLLSLNLVSEDNLSKALEAQALAADGMDVDQAANILTTAIAKSCTVSHASSLLLGSQKATELESDPSILPLYQLLQLAGLLSPQDVATAVKVGTQDTDIMSLMLQKAGMLDSQVISAAVACTDLVGKHVLKTEQAIMAVNHCKHTRSSVYEFFDEFGWSHPEGLISETSVTGKLSEPAEPSVVTAGVKINRTTKVDVLGTSGNPSTVTAGDNRVPVSEGYTHAPVSESDSHVFASESGAHEPVKANMRTGPISMSVDEHQAPESKSNEASKESKPRRKLRDLIP